VGTRAAQAISKVVMAAVKGPEIRIAMGSAAPTVVRLKSAEGYLNNGGPVEQAEAAARDEVVPIDDIRSSRAYRERIVICLLREWDHRFTSCS
jgi:xanthine dehydrogenase small subunit